MVMKQWEQKKFYLEDILHSGNKGEALTSKVGEKYDELRGNFVILYKNLIKDGCGVILSVVDEDSNLIRHLRTTPFKSIYQNGEYVMLKTTNSIYKLKPTALNNKDKEFIDSQQWLAYN